MVYNLPNARSYWSCKSLACWRVRSFSSLDMVARALLKAFKSLRKPTPEESRHIWQAMLPEISEEEAWTLAKQYAFSGGQIENIARKQIVNSILFPEESRDLNKIRQACDSEYLNKKQTRPIGFC